MPSTKDNICILYCEDNSMFSEAIVMLLKMVFSTKLEIIIKPNAKLALDYLLQNTTPTPDLIISDLKMGDGQTDGLELFHQLRTVNIQTPFILYTNSVVALNNQQHSNKFFFWLSKAQGFDALEVLILKLFPKLEISRSKSD